MVLSGEELLSDETATGVIHGIEAPSPFLFIQLLELWPIRFCHFSAHKPPTTVTAGRQKGVLN
jgi:hypothetical protein